MKISILILQNEAIQLPDNFHHELESFLEKQLDRTNYWLSFAEAKNAALIAFNVAIIAFIAEFQEDLPIFSTVIMILSVVSTVICLISFIPITNNCTTINTHATAVTPNEQKDNLIFWHDIISNFVPVFGSCTFFCRVLLPERSSPERRRRR